MTVLLTSKTSPATSSPEIGRVGEPGDVGGVLEDPVDSLNDPGVVFDDELLGRGGSVGCRAQGERLSYGVLPGGDVGGHHGYLEKKGRF